MSMQSRIEARLSEKLGPYFMQVINESDNHNVPPGSESHFKLVLVSDEFNGMNLLARHRLINTILKDELEQSIHALAMHTYTKSEWADIQGDSPASPPCMGGGK